jgi:D-glycero-alpha-D-manno-heptose-7-phosphate kinase
MIGIRTPFRVSFGGGATDIPKFYREFGGKVISTSIDKYMYHFIHKFSNKDIQVKYSVTELVSNPKDIKHPIVKEISEIYNIMGLDINSIADIPKGSGLGSSSAYTVGLVNGLSQINNENLSKIEISEIASDIEINKLGDPIGKQDHYASAIGGLNILTFNKDDTVEVDSLNLSKDHVQHLASSMILIKYGDTRNAATILHDQSKNLDSKSNVDQTKGILELVDPMILAIQNGDIKLIGNILNENWNLKNKLSDLISNEKLENTLSEILNKKGIYGGKLLGAGGNGYLLIVGEDKELKKLKNDYSLSFNFDTSGTQKILSDNL